MSNLNELHIIGNLGRDPEMRTTSNGTSVCNFTVAVNEQIGQDKTTTWFKVSCWGKLAEIVAKYAIKGRQVYCSGPIRSREYEHQGQTKTAWEMTAFKVLFLGGRDDTRPSADPMPAAVKSDDPGPVDDDLPF